MSFLMTPTARKWSLALFFLLGATILLKGYDQLVPYGVRYVFTPSIPTGLYGSVRYDHTPLTRGEGVCFKPIPTGWVAARGYFQPGEIICKFVLGVPGDEVRAHGPALEICHDGSCASAGTVMPADRQGRPSQSAFTGTTVIPAGKYYMGATHNPRSFDSRYLGLIAGNLVTVRISPIWTQD